jgi:hypothetical protein
LVFQNDTDASDLSSRSFLTCLRYVMAIFPGAAALCLVFATYRCPLIWDAQVFHYGNFLIAHGFAPYREIIDMNMPGAYLIDGWAIKVFICGDLAWRIFDFTLLGTLCLAMLAIARRRVSRSPQNSRWPTLSQSGFYFSFLVS